MSRHKKERLSPPIVGGSALLVIFAVLCLTVFALLSLSTVQAERRLSDTARDAARAYYAADLEAQKIFARLRAGEAVPGVECRDAVYSYSCEISENQKLMIELEQTENAWQVLRWQSVAAQGEIDDSLPVWEGA